VGVAEHRYELIMTCHEESGRSQFLSNADCPQGAGNTPWECVVPEHKQVIRLAWNRAYRGTPTNCIPVRITESDAWFRVGFLPSPMPCCVVVGIWRHLHPAWQELTKREREVIESISHTIDPAETASLLGVAISTIESHRRSIMFKAGLGGSPNFYRFCIMNGRLR
jgi:DNA-binding CsgD family transcriptional regulator